MKTSDTKSGPALADGSPITLHRKPNLGRKPVHVTVDRIDDALIWVKGVSPTLGDGDAVLIEYKLADDGRYLADAEVVEQRPHSTLISRKGAWRRVQDRSFVRISTHGIEVKSPAPSSPEPDSKDDHFEMLDISAGGTCFETREDFDLDDEFICHFDLPGGCCYVLPARVVRVQPKKGQAGRYRVAVEFVDLGEEHRCELLRWIYQEQTRRHRVENRKKG